ncbi:hypothetical protein Msil_1583 [Methylocella silvestris BL2]|uniref:Uncharacterized protein n=1 Tax=Methylocella silvestris (strain DSM 15510 / CIP 108128 / LMG 27833 / NCIMB 13906 / BL2) TaxID=395965 RepID=B8EI50_METSB|nr:hypothetical protein Msil_1583 [Methylocella silvestris BL2]
MKATYVREKASPDAKQALAQAFAQAPAKANKRHKSSED